MVLSLSFLMGLERESQKAVSERYRFGGVRTFPLLGMLGYALCAFSDANLLLPAVGFAVVGAFLWQSYRHKLEGVALAGMNTELSGLLAYVIGALVSHGQYWIATTIAVLCIALLELKTALEGLAKRIPADEILTFSKFLLLTAVILPIVPNRALNRFGFNPFKMWMVVVAVSAISYGSYLLQVVTAGRGGVLLSALLGGAYSSTLTTVVLAKRAGAASRPHRIPARCLSPPASCICASSRSWAFSIGSSSVGLECRSCCLLPSLSSAVGFGPASSDRRRPKWTEKLLQPKNPLELGAAFVFAALFVGMLFITHFAVLYLGRAGLFALAGVMGVTDVDPFILSLAASSSTSVALAGGAIVIAAASNNMIKGYLCLRLCRSAYRDPGTRSPRWNRSVGTFAAIAVNARCPARANNASGNRASQPCRSTHPHSAPSVADRLPLVGSASGASMLLAAGAPLFFFLSFP